MIVLYGTLTFFFGMHALLKVNDARKHGGYAHLMVATVAFAIALASGLEIRGLL